MADYKESHGDYTGGRETTAELVIMIGVSGSGKSTLVKSWVRWGRGDVVRLNKDEMRKLVYDTLPWGVHKDNEIRKMEVAMARVLLKAGKTVVIDDTNCVPRTRSQWEQVAREERVRVRRVAMTVPQTVCVERDAARPEDQRVGAEVIKRQMKDLGRPDDIVKEEPLTRAVWDRRELIEGLWTPRLPGAKWVIVDVDGTMADHTDVRNQYDESQVLHDKPYPVVVAWVQALYPFFNVLVCSGRKTKCGDDTVDWLEMQGVKFDRILMRPWKDNRKDAIVKKELLDDFMSAFKFEDVAFILDDRPQVIRMWHGESEVPEARHNYGRFTVYPVRGAVEEF